MHLSGTIARDDPNPGKTMELLDTWVSRWKQTHQQNMPNKAPGHQDRATRDNTMGGSQANKPEHL